MVFPSHTSKDASDDPPEESGSQPAPGKVARCPIRWNTAAGGLVVSVLVIASLLLFHHFSPALGSHTPVGNSIGASASTPVVAHSEVHG